LYAPLRSELAEPDSSLRFALALCARFDSALAPATRAALGLYAPFPQTVQSLRSLDPFGGPLF